MMSARTSFACIGLMVGLLLGWEPGCAKDAPQPPPSSKSAPATTVVPSSPTASQPRRPEPPPPKPIEIHGRKARLTTSRGVLILEFFPEDAPKTVENFIRLAEKGFYDGVRFHRVETGTLVQTGDPSGTGAGGAGWTIPFEANRRRHLIGSVAMALSGEDKNSASSQFYICLRPLPELDGEYTVFGRIAEGLSVLPNVEQNDILEKIEIIPAE